AVLAVPARTRPSPAPLVLTPPCRVRRERLAVTVRTAPRAPQALTLLSPALQDRRGRPGKMARTPPSLVPQDRQDQQARTAATVAVSRPSPAKSQAHGSSRTQTEQRAVPPGRARPSPLHHQENPLATEAQVRSIAALHTEKLHLAVQRELDARVVKRLQDQDAMLSEISAQVETLRRIIVNS